MLATQFYSSTSYYSSSSYSSYTDGRGFQSHTAFEAYHQQTDIVLDPVEAKPAAQRDNFAVFERALSVGYRKLEAQFEMSLKGDNPLPVSGPESTPQTLSSETVAGNILGFIERRLMMDQREGASQEALESRLEAGLAGFEKGFEEAREQLGAINSLTPEVESQIGETYERVTDGAEGLREKFLSSREDERDDDDDDDRKADVISTPPASGTTGVEREFRAAAHVQQAQQNSFSFELETRDGDKVTINAEALEAFSARYRAAGGNGALQERFGSSYSAENSFSLEIDGELDSDELAAINELLGQVNNLAADFFAGDYDQAFAAALEVGYDESEIAGFALQLTHTETQRVSTAYQAQGDKSSVSPLAERLLPVGHFARELLDSVERASIFSQPIDLLSQLAEQVAERHNAEKADRFPAFVSQLGRALTED